MSQNHKPEAMILANDRPSAIGDDLYQWALDAEGMIRRLQARVEELEKDRGNAKRLVSKIWNQHPEARDTIEKATGAWLVFGQDVETDGVSAQWVTQSQTLKASGDWLIDGSLLYRLNDRGTNCDEINVSMAHGLRTEAARIKRAEEILNILTIQKTADHVEQPITPVAAPVVLPEPDSYLFQHEDTGQTMFVEAQQVEWGFEANNPRLQKISGVYTEEQVRELLAANGITQEKAK